MYGDLPRGCAGAALNPPCPLQAPDVRGRFGVSPLQLAGWANSAEAAEAMLAAGAPLDTCDDRLRTAGHAAAASDASEALEVLLSCGAHREVSGRGAI
jgi:ankyrin repeat protein